MTFKEKSLSARLEHDEQKDVFLKAPPPLDGEEIEEVDAFTISHLRYYIVLIGTLASAIGISCHFAYTSAVVCNVNQTTDSKSIYEADPRNSPVMYFPPLITNMIFSVFPAGNIIMLFALILLQSKVSVRTQVMVGSLISTVATALIPVLYDIWPYSTPILKFVQGAAVAPTIPLIGHIAAHWTPLAEVGFIVAVLSSYSQIGIFFTMATSGVICTNFGWRAIFYVHAGASAFCLLLWVIVFRDRPADHPFLSKREYVLIREHEKMEETKKKPTVPYRAFFSNTSVWAVLIAAIGNYNGISPLIVYAMPILKKSIGLSDLAASNYNSISFAMQFALKLISGRLSDSWQRFDESTKTRLFNTISCGLSGVLMISTAFLPEQNQVLCAVFITLTQGIIGFNSAGFNKAAMIVTKQYAHFTVTLIGVIISASTIGEPFLVLLLARETTWKQWSMLFMLHGMILVVSNVLFCIMIRAEPADFTKMKVVAEDEKAKSADAILESSSPSPDEG